MWPSPPAIWPGIPNISPIAYQVDMKQPSNGHVVVTSARSEAAADLYLLEGLVSRHVFGHEGYKSGQLGLDETCSWLIGIAILVFR